MNQIITYLIFNGNCREAMSFYQNCLGGNLHLQTVDDPPVGGDFPDTIKDFIVQATLKKDHLILMGTDMADERVTRGNAMYILLECYNEEELKHYFSMLSNDGIITTQLDKTHWGDWFGGLTDRYGHRWLFHCHE